MNIHFATAALAFGRGLGPRTLRFAALTALASFALLLNLGAAPTLTVTTIAGAAGQAGYIDGAAGAARLKLPRGITADNSGNVYFTEPTLAVVRKVAPDGTVSTLAGGIRGMLDGTGAAARFDVLWSIGSDAAGNVYVSDATG